MTHTQESAPTVRPCVEDCGLAAAVGDVYCDGCRSAVNDDARYNEAMNERVGW